MAVTSYRCILLEPSWGCDNNHIQWKTICCYVCQGSSNN